MQEISGYDRIGRVRLGIEHRTPRGHWISFVRPQAREPEVKLHDCDAWVELRELLEPVERPVGPRGKRSADLRLQGVVPRKKTRRGGGVAARVERLGFRQIARLGVGAKAESERERRMALARAGGRGLRRPSRVTVRGEHDTGDNRDGGRRNRSDEQHDATPRGHRRTIARHPTL